MTRIGPPGPVLAAGAAAMNVASLELAAIGFDFCRWRRDKDLENTASLELATSAFGFWRWRLDKDLENPASLELAIGALSEL